MSDPVPSPSVPDSVDAQDLAPPEGAAVEVPDAGDELAQAVAGAAPADEVVDVTTPAEAPPAAPAAGDAGPDDGAAPTESTAPPSEEAPAPEPSGPIDPHDLAPALDVAGIAHDLGPTGASEGAADGQEGELGEAARSGKAVDMTLGVVRLGVGVALVAAPRWAGRIWVGPGADGPGSLVFARALGARDVALGLRILDGVRKGEPVRHWVAAGFAADAADVAATLIAGQHLTPGRRAAMPLVAAAVGALGVVSARRS